MDPRAELIALRRLAELEAKAGGSISKQIENDPISQGARNFAKDMPLGQQILAGTGKAFADIGRGSAQLLSGGKLGPTMKETAETRQRDAPLMDTGGGLAGNVAGNVAALAPLALVPGANTVGGATALGGLAAAVQPTLGVGERLGNMALGAGLGGGSQLVASHPMEVLDVAKKVATGPFKAAKAVAEPLYEGGREKILARMLRKSIGDNSDDVARRLGTAGELVPGSRPTAAEAGGSAGLAALQRTAAATDPEQYATRATQQNEARVNALLDMAGTKGAREFASENRRATSQQLYDQAYDLGVDLTKMSPARRGEITKLLKTPALQNAVKEARTLASNEMVNLKNPAGSVKGLDYVKRALDDQIGATSGNEQRVLTSLKHRLLTTIDTLSPEYASARQVHQQMSKPINQMDTAQLLADRSIRPLDNTMQASSYARALRDDTAQQATGFGKATLENTFEPQQLQGLNAIKDDLARSVYARDAGRGPGSDTVQKLSMRNMMGQAGLPDSAVNFPGVSRFGSWIYEGADERMRNQLSQSLLNPQETARLIRQAPAPTQPPMPIDAETRRKLALMLRSTALPSVPYAAEQTQ